MIASRHVITRGDVSDNRRRGAYPAITHALMFTEDRQSRGAGFTLKSRRHRQADAHRVVKLLDNPVRQGKRSAGDLQQADGVKAGAPLHSDE
ncbi:MAG: hypothetical protein K5880_02765 [Hydrogenophaga sp.]|uniref:hypothetical protein n=1 Tax=Hydrogenophaga sp. TaxID=1904254 RepID=UPI00260B2995|nr:hypothetical protein [Hydrogenophaga sp.]MCV0437522.1 hypothetical protein [Hydrogenophaga sp.]